MKNTTFNSSNIEDSTLVSILDKQADRIDFMNIYIMCAQSLSVVEGAAAVNIFGHYIHHHYLCNQHCQGVEYTYEAGSTILQGSSSAKYFANLSFMSIAPGCSPCPVGANCMKHCQSLQNWGFKDHSDMVTMIRCPNGYCCQYDDMCKGIDSCNKNRTRPLCGRCQTNWTESLFSTECLLLEHCLASEIIVLYIVCLVVYGFSFMAFIYVKGVSQSVLKFMFRKLSSEKRKRHDPVDAYVLNCILESITQDVKRKVLK